MLEKDEIETEQWRQGCLKKYRTFFDLNNKLFQLAENIENMANTGKINRDTPLHDVIAFLFSKAHKTFWAIDILAQRGFGQDAAILARSLFEILVTIKYLAEGDKSRVNKYLSFIKFQDKKLIDRYIEDVKSGKILPIPEFQAVSDDKEKMKQIEKEYEEAKLLYKKNRIKNTWSGLSIPEMVEKVDLYKVDLYYERKYLYPLLSDQVHSTVTAAKDYINKDGDWVIGPSEKLLPPVLLLSPAWFNRILEVVNREFQLGFEDQISGMAEALEAHSAIE